MRPSSRSVAPLAVTTEPKALKRMFGRLRPIAALMSRVSRMPEAPTRVPATMSRFEPSVKPDAATATPVKELSSEISTGTSAPPIGRTKATPSTNESAKQDPQPDEVEPGDQDRRDEDQRAGAEHPVEQLLAGVGHRPAGHQLLELGEGDRRARRTRRCR